MMGFKVIKIVPADCVSRPTQVTGERGALMQAMHLLSWHLRANPPLETPGKAPPALRELTMPQAEPQTLAPRQQAGVYAAPPQLSPGQV